MSQIGGFLLAAGSWTVISFAYLSYYVFPGVQLPLAAAGLAGSLVLTYALSVAAGLGRSHLVRHLATTLQLTAPLLWVEWMASISQAAVTPEQWIAYAGCAFFGVALADQGVYMEITRTCSRVKCAGALPIGTLQAFDSGGYPRLSACDSGSFRAP
jgi:uncharacterized membrane protein YbhN (UPF0104 family)